MIYTAKRSYLFKYHAFSLAPLGGYETSPLRTERRPPGGAPNKSGVVSQISTVLGKHKVTLPSDMLSKLTTRSRQRNKGGDTVSQLEEVRGIDILVCEFVLCLLDYLLLLVFWSGNCPH